MSKDATCTITGTMVRDPELRYIPSGTALATIGVAVNERKKNDQTGKWEDGDTSFFDITVWGQMAENVAESLAKGDRIVVSGDMKIDYWETDSGEKRSKMKVTANSIGPDLRFATSVTNKVRRESADDRQATPAPAAANPFAKAAQGEDPEAPF
jgi:single-strand DNA-binding protein